MNIVNGAVVSTFQLLQEGLETFSSPVLAGNHGKGCPEEVLLLIGSRQNALHCASVINL